ncbi:unnamed protein product [Blepharisma stoltei]|uniref:FHA domain-containing protein n=1 Tax=Blepharisma stoltei TaxID=1481888 RepID=A0AAU9JF91_9CILI|nr:unnamed protein product [Blepharisma stoltei]
MQRDLEFIEKVKKNKANFQKLAQEYFSPDLAFMQNIPNYINQNKNQWSQSRMIESSNSNIPESSQTNFTPTNIEKLENSPRINTNFELLINQKGTIRPITISKRLTTIGGREESDEKLGYADTNELIFTARNDKLFVSESVSPWYEASIKIRTSILYKGASFKIGDQHSNLFIEEVYQDRSIKLKIEPHMKESIMLGRDGGTIGRGPKNKICIEDFSIGKVQAEIKCNQGIWIIKDLLPAYGIFRYLHNANSLDKQKNSPEIEVKDGDLIKLESSGFEIHVENSD